MPHVITHDQRVNLLANIRAAREALDARIRAGGNWKSAANAARELGHLLDQLAEWDADADAERQPRQRVIEPPPPPRSRAEFVHQRAALRRRKRYEVIEERPALPEPGP